MRRLRRGAIPLDRAHALAGKMVRCLYCYGHIGRDDYGRICRHCGGRGYIYHDWNRPPANAAEPLRMPPNSCTKCGDGTEPGHELCDGCERARRNEQPSNIPEDNWRRSLRFPTRRR